MDMSDTRKRRWQNAAAEARSDSDDEPKYTKEDGERILHAMDSMRYDDPNGHDRTIPDRNLPPEPGSSGVWL